MFRSQQDHLIETTLKYNEKFYETISLTFINQTKWFNDFDMKKFKPVYIATDLSTYFGRTGKNNMDRFGSEFQAQAKKQMEDSFCTVILSDDNRKLNDLLFEVRCVLDNSVKTPLILLITPQDFDVDLEKDNEKIVTKKTALDLKKMSTFTAKIHYFHGFLSAYIGEFFARIYGRATAFKIYQP